MRQSVILLGNTGTRSEITGHKIRAAGYYGSGMNTYTMVPYITDFSGRIYLEGSLANDPYEEDWFKINLNGYQEYLEFLPHLPDLYGNTGTTAVFPISFQGNFVWLRAKIDRSFLMNPDTSDYGQIDQILLNF